MVRTLFWVPVERVHRQACGFMSVQRYTANVANGQSDWVGHASVGDARTDGPRILAKKADTHPDPELRAGIQETRGVYEYICYAPDFEGYHGLEILKMPFVRLERVKEQERVLCVETVRMKQGYLWICAPAGSYT